MPINSKTTGNPKKNAPAAEAPDAVSSLETGSHAKYLTAALDTFLDRGYAGTSIEEIARAAKDKVISANKNLDFEAQCKVCEMEGIVSSLNNLKCTPQNQHQK